METKICKRCGEEKPRNAFHRDARTKDGFRGVCKDCINASLRAARWRKAHPVELVRPRAEKTCATCLYYDLEFDDDKVGVCTILTRKRGKACFQWYNNGCEYYINKAIAPAQHIESTKPADWHPRDDPERAHNYEMPVTCYDSAPKAPGRGIIQKIASIFRGLR